MWMVACGIGIRISKIWILSWSRVVGMVVTSPSSAKHCNCLIVARDHSDTGFFHLKPRTQKTLDLSDSVEREGLGKEIGELGRDIGLKELLS